MGGTSTVVETSVKAKDGVGSISYPWILKNQKTDGKSVNGRINHRRRLWRRSFSLSDFKEPVNPVSLSTHVFDILEPITHKPT